MTFATKRATDPHKYADFSYFMMPPVAFEPTAFRLKVIWMQGFSRTAGQLSLREQRSRAAEACATPGFANRGLSRRSRSGAEPRSSLLNRPRAIRRNPRPPSVGAAAMRAQRPPTAVPCLVASAEALPFDDASIDVAMGVYTDFHWSDRAGGIAEMMRVARHSANQPSAALQQRGDFGAERQASEKFPGRNGRVVASWEETPELQRTGLLGAG